MQPLSILRRTGRCLAVAVRRRMPARDAVRAAEAFVEIAAVRVALRVAPSLAMRSANVAPSALRDVPFDEVVNVFAKVAREHPLQPNCLQRSLALQRMLARRGVATRLRIAVGRRPAMLPGHAWLEHDGRIVNDAPEVVARYEPLEMSAEAMRMVR